MAAYASVVSLLNTMEQIQSHPHLSTCFDKYQNESLRKKVDFFLDFLENYSDAGSRETEDLMKHIAFMAHAAGVIIECQAANRVRDGSTKKRVHMLLNLQRVIDDMSSVEEKVIKLVKEEEEEAEFIKQQPRYPRPPALSTPAAKAAMVGFDSYLVQLLDELTGHPCERRVIPVVGMGGIGKTTLARNIYENQLTVQHFDVRAWVTVSQDYNARDILSQALSCLGEVSIDQGSSEGELGEKLHKTLSGRRYLVVLDDVWSVEVWETMMLFFPENLNGSRIVVTTRLSEVVNYFGSSALTVDFLDDSKSWDLFHQKTFPQESCPPELEEIGKKIVSKCKGLPLAIVVIGGLLGKSSRAREYWEKIANDISLILDSRDGNKVLSILYLSYKHLPVCLKSCFLHLGLFPEDYDIGLSQLIQLWVAEGLIKPNTRQSLEETAEGYVKELIDRSLLLVRRVGRRKRVKTCCIHDLVRDLSTRIAEEEKFVCVQRGIDGRPKASFYPLNIRNQRTRLVRPKEKTTMPCRSRLVRVLAREGGSLDYAMPEVNLRYLFHNSTLHGIDAIDGISLPSSISLMWSLQTLIIGARCHVPFEIWEMPQLRHIDISGFHLPHPRPCPPSGGQDVVVLRNLQTLKRLDGFECTEEVCKRIPNIKELDIYSSWFDSVYNVGSFTKLESLYYGFHGSAHPYNPLKGLEFLIELRRLCLQQCNFVWSDMKTLASLPLLEVLSLWGKAKKGDCFTDQWDSVEEGFLSLKYLHISGCDAMVCWFAGCSHFLALETLLLDNICELEEIPPCVGEIATLQRMVLQQCSDSVLRSAIEILEEQKSLGNEELVVEVEFHDQTRAEAFKDKFQLQAAFTNPNLRYTCRFN